MLDKKEAIQERLIEEEMKDSYLTYSMSVIISRALPDVRDGLKPSQRRILVAMNDLGLGPRSRFRKCAKIAGDTSGNYHPHGEAVVYPTLVRMAQDWNMRCTLVNGQGNFGSIDGDPPAAMRYTEARLTGSAMEMLSDLKLDTVDYIPNYDETRTEPTVLPSKFPNLIVNGANGIAVGMATSVPPHNLGEVVSAIVALIESPDITVDELMEHMPGPDFPTGGVIRGESGIQDAYRTGKGKITLRAAAHTEQKRGGKTCIVVTEIPYQVTKTRIIEKIAELVKRGTLKGISDVRDESDRDGLRLVIDLKRGDDERVVLNKLYKHTPLQDTFSIILLALVDGRPQTLNLKQLLQEFLSHRMTIIKRRTQFLLDKANDRLHIVEGLLKAIKNIDRVIEIIRGSKEVDEARESLMSEFMLTEVQANAILAMQLQRLVGLEQIKLRGEEEELNEKIREYWAILGKDELVYDIIREDLYELKEKYGDGRRTEIAGAVREFKIEDLIAEESVAVTVSHEGYIKRTRLSLYRSQQRGGKGVIGSDVKEEDFAQHLFVASTHDYIMFFTDAGKVYWLKVYDVPMLSRTSRGRAIVNLLQVPKGEQITSMVPVRKFDDRYLLLATEKGVIKKTVLSAYGHPKRGGIIAINLDKGDKLIGAMITHGNDQVVLGTQKGYAIRFGEQDVRAMGRSAHGVRGIKLRKGDVVKSMIMVDKNSTLLTVCENGFGKRTDFGKYRLQSRAGKGVINIKTSKRNGNVVGLMSVREDDEVMIITTNGKMIRIPVKGVRVIGRSTQGVTLIKMGKDDRIGSFTRIAQKEEEDSTEAPELPDEEAGESEEEEAEEEELEEEEEGEEE
jgi:DNA gyrase subunit A